MTYCLVLLRLPLDREFEEAAALPLLLLSPLWRLLLLPLSEGLGTRLLGVGFVLAFVLLVGVDDLTTAIVLPHTGREGAEGLVVDT